MQIVSRATLTKTGFVKTDMTTTGEVIHPDMDKMTAGVSAFDMAFRSTEMHLRTVLRQSPEPLQHFR